MRLGNYFFTIVAVLALIPAAHAQHTEVAITLNDGFFNTIVDSIFNNFDLPEFPIAGIDKNKSGVSSTSYVAGFSESRRGGARGKGPCSQSIKILKEGSGVRTSVRIRDGKIFVPIAFSGTYSPPFVGCVEFAGWADSSIDLEFDREGQRLIGRTSVASVNLNGTGGVGGTFIARMLQGALDKKMNPLEILRLDKISFVIPIQNTGNLRLRAVGVRPEISSGVLTVHIDYDVLKG